MLYRKLNRNTCEIMLSYGDEIGMFRNRYSLSLQTVLRIAIRMTVIFNFWFTAPLTGVQANFGQQGPQLVCMRN